MVHLKRDFQAMVDRDNSGSAIGTQLLLLMDVLFGWWHHVRDGTLSRATFRRYVASLREDVLAVLEQGCACRCVKTAATCRELLAVEEALWTFVRVTVLGYLYEALFAHRAGLPAPTLL